MEIQYLKYFQKILAFHDRNESNLLFVSAGLTIEQIEALEQYFFPEGKQQLPLALRELLYLCGAFCPYFDTGSYLRDQHTIAIDALLQQQASNPYFKSREKHEWPCFFEPQEIWTICSVYESSDNFWFVDLRANNEDPLLSFFNTEALYGNATDNVILAHIDQEQKEAIPLSQMIVEIYREHCVCYDETVCPDAYLSLYQENATQEDLQARFIELVRYRDLEGMRYFLGKGLVLSENKEQALWLAAKMNHREGISLLFDVVENKAGLAEDFMLLAIKEDLPYVLHNMLDLASQEGKDKALALAAALNKLELLESLLQHAASIDSNDGLPLCLALRNQHNEIIETLAYKDASGGLNAGFALLFQENLAQHNLSWLLTGVSLKIPAEELILRHEQQLKDLYGKHYDQSFFAPIVLG